jgi:nanoRNase/pAp phosphatase (c-di-AMP/oligoRNAs hydrolase)
MISFLDTQDGFVLVGHARPDEDCLSAMVAFALLVGKLNKRCVISLRSRVPPQYAYLLSICKYNSIEILQDENLPPGSYSAIIAMDTPKPSMLDLRDDVRALAEDPLVRRMEIDHHLEADAEYFADDGYALVASASSASELVGYLAYKMEKNKDLIHRYGISEIFSRNFVLAVLTGIIGDSKLGKYLKTKRETRLYEWFSSLFDKLLAQKTRSGSGNFMSKEQVYHAIESLSSGEEALFGKLMATRKQSEYTDYPLINESEVESFQQEHGTDGFISVVKAVADAMAEENGHLSLVAYPDAGNLFQFRIRRNRSYSAIDLRTLLLRFKFMDGGGHPGAVGFRLNKEEISDPESFILDLVGRIAIAASELS